jgi:hypothetical protein
MNRIKHTSKMGSKRSKTRAFIVGNLQRWRFTAALVAIMGFVASTYADRVNHDVAAAYLKVDQDPSFGGADDNANWIITTPISVNGLRGLQEFGNRADFAVQVGETRDDDATTGVMIFAVAQNLRNNFGTNVTHTVSMSIVNSGRSFEAATQSVPLNAGASFESNVDVGAAWFPFATWIGGYALNSVNGGVISNFVASPGLELGVHFFDFRSTNGPGGRAYLDLRSFGIDSRRDGVLLVNHAKNEGNYALSKVNDEDGTWEIFVHDNRANGRSYEQDPISFVFVPRTNTAVVSGSFMGDGEIQMFSGEAPQFTVTWLTNISNGRWELKIPGRSPKDGVLVISPAGDDPFNGDNIVTYEANAAGDGWEIQSRDLPNSGLQSPPPEEVVCSFIFVPAEQPGITVTPTRNIITTESGGTAQFTVTVSGYPKPTADVTINLSSSDTTEGTVSPSTLVITPENWNVPQVVTVTGVDDAEVDNMQFYTINVGVTTSSDPRYNGIDPENVLVGNADNEPGASISASLVTTAETGTSDTFTVWLNTQPTADVTVTLSSSDLTEATVSPTTLVFTPLDYYIPQVVTVTGVDDKIADGPGSYFVVTAALSSADPIYNGFKPVDVPGVNLDDDVAGVLVPFEPLTVSEPNGTATFQVVLTSEPTANVTVNFVSSDSTEGTVTPSVTFTPANWNVPKTVTVTAVDDLIGDGTVSFTIITSITSSDPVYAAINPDDVTVFTLDNEVALTLSEGAANYAVGDVATGIDGYATVTDPDTADYNGGSLTVAITAGGSSVDRLAIRNDGTAAGQVSVSGSTVTYGGVAVGTVSGGTGTTALVVSFNAAATPEAAQAVVRAVTYRSTDDSVFQAPRTVTYTFNDGRSGISTASKQIQIGLLRVYSYQQDGDGGFGAYTGAADIQIHPDSPFTPYPAGSSPTAGMWIDYQNLLGNPQVLMRFTNLVGTAAGQIPPGARIVSAEFVVNVTDSGHGWTMNRMLGDWDSESTYFETFGSDGINLDNVEALSATNAFLGDVAHNTTTGGGLMTIGVTVDVQAWINGTNNYGWVLSPWNGGDNGTAFSPCEATNVTLRPRLVVKWLPADVSVATFRQGADGYTGAVDTQVREIGPDQEFSGTSPLAPDWIVTGSAPNPQQVLLRFDNIIGNGAGQVPSGSMIYAAIVELTSFESASQGDGGKFHAMLKPWSATDTWNSLVGGISADGVEAKPEPTTTIGPEDPRQAPVQSTTHHINLTADVQAWANGAANYGWVILPWPNGSDGWGISSAEAPDLMHRPQLRVYYGPSVGPEVITLQAPTIVGGQVQLNFTGLAGRTYSVQRAGTVNGSWTTIGTATANSSGAATYTDSTPPAGSAFYRIVYP